MSPHRTILINTFSYLIETLNHCLFKGKVCLDDSESQQIAAKSLGAQIKAGEEKLFHRGGIVEMNDP